MGTGIWSMHFVALFCLPSPGTDHLRHPAGVSLGAGRDRCVRARALLVSRERLAIGLLVLGADAQRNAILVHPSLEEYLPP